MLNLRLERVSVRLGSVSKDLEVMHRRGFGRDPDILFLKPPELPSSKEGLRCPTRKKNVRCHGSVLKPDDHDGE